MDRVKAIDVAGVAIHAPPSQELQESRHTAKNEGGSHEVRMLDRVALILKALGLTALQSH